MTCIAKMKNDCFALVEWEIKLQPSGLHIEKEKFELLALDFGVKESLFMKKKTSSDKPVGKLKVIADFLPSPEKLFPKVEMVKITLSVDETTLKFFKTVAKTSKTQYQKMMREVLKRYAGQYDKAG
jgi:hypothetical protein